MPTDGQVNLSLNTKMTQKPLLSFIKPPHPVPHDERSVKYPGWKVHFSTVAERLGIGTGHQLYSKLLTYPTWLSQEQYSEFASDAYPDVSVLPPSWDAIIRLNGIKSIQNAFEYATRVDYEMHRDFRAAAQKLNDKGA